MSAAWMLRHLGPTVIAVCTVGRAAYYLACKGMVAPQPAYYEMRSAAARSTPHAGILTVISC